MKKPQLTSSMMPRTNAVKKIVFIFFQVLDRSINESKLLTHLHLDHELHFIHLVKCVLQLIFISHVHMIRLSASVIEFFVRMESSI